MVVCGCLAGGCGVCRSIQVQLLVRMVVYSGVGGLFFTGLLVGFCGWWVAIVFGGVVGVLRGEVVQRVAL